MQIRKIFLNFGPQNLLLYKSHVDKIDSGIWLLMQKLPCKDDVADEGEDENVGLGAEGVHDGQGHDRQ